MQKKRNLFLSTILLLTIVVIVIISVKNAFDDSNVVEVPIPSETPTITPSDTPMVTPTEAVTIYEGFSPKGGSHFIEELPKIAGEQGYVAYPKQIKDATPPYLVIYYHGSTQRITTNVNDEVMKNMRIYGSFFAERNIAFLASNQHGDNWGSKIAVEDSRALIKWVRERYKTSNEVYVLGFSMGGQPALKHVILYPKEVTRIALLAPAQQVETYTATQIKLFREVPLKVWHGTADVNVPYWVTEELVTYFKKQNTPVEVVTLKGKTHWDVDTEYREEIWKWFSQLAN